MVYYSENSSPFSETNIVNQSFAWMFGGLLLTALASLVVVSNNALANLILNNNIVFFGLIIAELALVFFLSLRVQNMSFGAALATFLVYSTLNGLTISSIFFIYTASSIASSFFIAALVFGVMALYGYTTKREPDLHRQSGFYGAHRRHIGLADKPVLKQQRPELYSRLPGYRDIRGPDSL